MVKNFASKAICYRYFFKATNAIIFQPKSFNQWQKAIELLFNFDFSIFHSHAPKSKQKFHFEWRWNLFFHSFRRILARSQFMTFNPIGRHIKLALAITSIFLGRKRKMRGRGNKNRFSEVLVTIPNIVNVFPSSVYTSKRLRVTRTCHNYHFSAFSLTMPR